MTIFPGAVWRPMPGQEKRPKRRKGRGVGFHVAVYTGPSIYDINLRTGNDAHLYVRLDGTVEQNIDLDLQAWAGADGNPSMIWVETAGGVNPATVNTERWNPAMVITLARIARWAHDTEGTPLELMPDSKPGSRGIGTHRLGITHSRGIGAVPGFRVSGGESWSKHIGKECPGDAKVGQVPGIIETARTGQTEDDVSAQEVWRDWGVQTPEMKAAGLPQASMEAIAAGTFARTEMILDQVNGLAKAPAGSAGAVDAAEVARLLAADTGFAEVLSDKVADKLAARLKS